VEEERTLVYSEKRAPGEIQEGGEKGGYCRLVGIVNKNNIWGPEKSRS